MAEIRPLRAWRYNETLSKQIDNLTSPLFDVVSAKQREALYQNEFNSIHLSVPKGPGGAQQAARRLAQWKKDGVIQQDPLPAVYVYYQYFKVAGAAREFCRKGFIINVRVYNWEDRIILRHENTIPDAVNDRIELLEKTELNVSPTHGLYTDGNYQLENFMDQAMTHPLLETEDYQGVRDVLAVIHDATVIQKFIDVLNEKTIILADGHHRYEGALHFMNKCKAENKDHNGNEGYNFHLMYLSNTEAGDFRILPTHRLVKKLAGFDEKEILRRLEKDFTIKPVEDADTVNEIIMGKRWAFGLLFRNNSYKIRLKPEVLATMTWHFPDEIKSLDLTVMHYFVIEKALGIPGIDQRKAPEIDFDRSFSDCLAQVIRGDAQMAIITQEISMEEIKKVCVSGYTMPQKSTYFYPKVICGFLFGSIKENEFHTPSYSRF